MMLQALGRIFLVLLLGAKLGVVVEPIHAQDSRTKIRISNSALSVTSLALLAAREWKHVQNYADAKSAVVQEILARALSA